MAAKYSEASQSFGDNVVELGFVEKVENPVILTSPFFPSKVGGKPAWLALTGLPTQILCRNCEKPLIFLLQVYVPSEEEKSPSYHRTVFVFCCRNGACYKSNCNKSFAAFRCQLARENNFYSPDSNFQEEDKILQEFEDHKAALGSGWTKLCVVCGCWGEKFCGKCHKVHYCSRDHQAIDWKTSHKTICGTTAQHSNESEQMVSKVLFPEYELVTEPEEINQDTQNNSGEEHERKYEKYLKDGENITATSNQDWNSLEAESKKISDVVEDKVYWEFKKMISYEPEQVLRYHRHGRPIWLSQLNKPNENDIPKCACGAKRTFEFQILPQLLNHMKVDSLQASIDWGTLVVYTCPQDCNKEEKAYHQEFVWKQDFTNTGLPADIVSKLN